jgi:hypothetical protein
MFQSIENPDASGTKTLHISLDSLSASVDTEFERIPTSQASPMIGPTGAEFRVVYSTENLGCVVSSDVSLDFEHLKSCLTPNDLSILISIVNTMQRRLQGVHHLNSGSNEQLDKRRRTGNPVSSLLRYQKRGTGIATSIRVEFQTFSFVVLRTFQSKYGAPEFLAFNVREFKAKLGGCMSALSGECTAGISVNFFNNEVSDWEYAVEPVPITLAIDQMPNELVSVNRQREGWLNCYSNVDSSATDSGFIYSSSHSAEHDGHFPSRFYRVGFRLLKRPRKQGETQCIDSFSVVDGGAAKGDRVSLGHHPQFDWPGY